MGRRPAGAAALTLVGAATPLHPEPALFDAMLEGWCRQHSARRLSPTITRQRVRVVRRFAEFTGGWPWEWQAGQLDSWVAQGRWAHSTVRNYEGSLALFLAYVCDPHYGWAEQCQQPGRHGPNPDLPRLQHRRPRRRERGPPRAPAAHPGRAAGTVRHRRRCGRGSCWFPSQRLARGLQGCHAFQGDLCLGPAASRGGDARCGRLRPNPAAPELGCFGTCHVRFGKAMRGSPPRRRVVASVMPWAVEVLGQYLADVRPLHGEPARARPCGSPSGASASRPGA